jgi:hypothetical protein
MSVSAWPKHWLPPRPQWRPPKDRNPSRPGGREYKPLGSPLFNLPGSLVDDLLGLDLRRHGHMRKAHELADALPQDEEETADDHAQRIRDTHRALWQLAESAPVIREEVNRLAAERALRAGQLQMKWSINEERKRRLNVNVSEYTRDMESWHPQFIHAPDGLDFRERME